MGKIYIPYDNISDYSCYVVVDCNTIRAYNNTLTVGNNNYTDFYINSHYLENKGVQVFENSSDFPTCLNINNLTNDYWYRNDISHIIIFVVFIAFFIYLGLRVFSRIFGKWMKV